MVRKKLDVVVEVDGEVLGDNRQVVGGLCGVSERWEEDEGEKGAEGGGVGVQGEERVAGVVGRGGEDVVCGSDGEVAGGGGREIGGDLGGGGGWGDEAELGVEVGGGDRVGGVEGVDVEVGGWRGWGGCCDGVGGCIRCEWEGVVVEVEVGGRVGLDEGVDMKRVGYGLGEKSELADNVAVDDGGDQWDGVAIVAEECHPEEHVVE